MHSIHTTPGFVIGSRPSGEAGKLISIFTRDLGLILATAQGIRFEKSKLRPFVQDHSLGVFSFVKGKEFWRLTSAQEDPDSGIDSADELVARIAALLSRLLQGEEPHADLFDIVRAALAFISTAALNDEEWKTLESLIVIRILHQLGYVGDIKELNGHLNSSDLDKGLLSSFAPQRNLMNQHINKALRESHL